ncbi:ImmA/IrrE family metallo-endopeptidase [Pimelobacter sp. 30-1]|uniref:ImmA/IrrE family metallo-endopeptidase n=1 Tax=Pimelobacter sp. 30-1 TaxID=2004991 RepID=UPI001C05E383|nr:hypothetical protein [Pimelobacter sp. 30-1]
MRNTYSPWRDLANRPQVDLVWRELPEGILGQYEHHLLRITLDPRMPRRQSRSVLAHELAHADARDVLSTCEQANRRQERRADHKAARRLIHIDDLADVMVSCDNHLSAMAVELHVSDALLRIRREMLSAAEKYRLWHRLAEAS